MAMLKEAVTFILLILFLIPFVHSITNVQHSVDANKVTLTYQGTPPYWINIKGDENIGQAGGYLWAKTYSNSFTYDMSFVVNHSKKFYYGVKDKSWSNTNYFELSSEIKKCGDGICDKVEKANPALCPQDCRDAYTGVDYSPFGFLGQYIDNSQTKQLNAAYGGFSAIQGFYEDLGVHWDRGAGRNGGAVWGAFKNKDLAEYKTYPKTFDDYVTTARNNNINLMITIIPAYGDRDSQDDSINGKKLPADLDGFARFVKELVQTHPSVKYWQLDNEINNGVFWKDTPQNYARLLRLTSGVIREACSDCKVVLGSSININGTGDPLPVELYFEPVLQELNKYGKNYFDVFDYHFFPPKGYTPESYYLAYAQGVASTRNLLDKYGYSDAEIWTTETMVPTTDGMSQINIQKLPKEYQSVTEKQQAKALIKTYVSGISNGVKKVFWTKLTEGPVFDFMFNRAGLIRHPSMSSSTDKKLSYYTYKKMVEVLDGSDWDNVQTIQESNGIYVYKFMKDGKQIWVVWNDNADEKQITISGISSGLVRVTEAVPKYESGKDITDYNTAFNVETKTVSSGSATITLKDKLIFVQE